MVSHGQHPNLPWNHRKIDGVRVLLQDAAPYRVIPQRLTLRRVRDQVKRSEYFGAEGVGGFGASGLVPGEGLSHLPLYGGRNPDQRVHYKALNQWRNASAGRVWARPAVMSSLRRRASATQDAVTSSRLEQSPSRLSNSDSATSDRSSGERASASRRTWSTRAFMQGSLAPHTPARQCHCQPDIPLHYTLRKASISGASIHRGCCI